MDQERSSQGPPLEREFLPGDYQLVGLVEDPGDRWVIDFDGELDARTRSVTLGHSYPDHLIAVCTAGRAESDRVRAPKGRSLDLDWSKEFAYRQLLTLLIWDCPSDLGHDERQRYLRGQGEYARVHAEALSEWELATWTLDGSPIEASVFRLGKSWVGVTDSDPQRRISALVRGSVPVAMSLDLAEVSSIDYGWDFTKPFKMSHYQPVVPDYVGEAQWQTPRSAGPEHRDVMNTEPQPVTYMGSGITYRLEVREVRQPEDG